MRSRIIVVCLALAAVAGLAATDSYEVATVENGGSITGRVVFAGTPPPPTKLDINTDVEVCGREEQHSRTLLVDGDGGVENALVHLGKIRRGKGWEVREYTLGQTACRFEPHVLLVREGADLHLLNTDRIPHNVRSYSVDSVFNVGQPRFVEKLLVEDFTTQLGDHHVNRIGCTTHNWMLAYVVVQEHPYYAVTDASGRFELSDVPPGEYELKLWHETLGEGRQKVTVEPGGETTVTFRLGD